MSQQDLSASLMTLAVAIDRRPLTVPPHMSLADVVTMMGKAQSSCTISGLGLSLNSVLMGEARASAILVVDGAVVVGIVAEPEVTRAITSGRDLAAIQVADVMQRPPIVLTETASEDVFAALSLLRQHQIHHLPIVDSQGHLVGLVTPASIRSALPLDELLKSTPLADLVASPDAAAIGVQLPATATLLEVAHQMVAHRVPCVVLTEQREDGAVQSIGSILQRHIIQLWALGVDLATMPAQAVMSQPLLRFPATTMALVAYWEMQQQQVQLFAVEANDELLGIVTPTSFLHSLNLDTMRAVVERVQASIAGFAATRDEPNAPRPDRMAQVLDNPAELLEQLECSQILTAMALHIRESLELGQILQTAVDEVRRFLQTDRVIIYRFSPDWSGTVVVESVAEGWRPALNSSIKDTCFAQNYAQAYKEGRTQVTEDIYTAGLTQCHIDILVLYDIRACLVVPILQGDHLWGLLCAYHCAGPRRWRGFEVELLKQLATHMAIAIQQSELYQQLQTELAERKRTEEQLKQSLQDKEVLLKEIHHRVKNNLQVISSVLRLQSDYVKDERVLDLFKDSQNRIRSMALIHEKLYQSTDLLSIDFDEYIRDLVHNLLRSYSTTFQSTTVRTNAESVRLNVDTAIPCGLIINELVLNSLKHAFPSPNPANEVWVSVTPTAPDQFVLMVRDNGIGFPDAIDFRNTESLGLELVCIFTEQLEGTIELDRSPGTTFRITFSELGSTGGGQ